MSNAATPRAVRWTAAAIVFQGALHSLNPVRRVGRQIEEAINLHADVNDDARARRRTGELLERVGLPADVARAYPHELSGGQRQRVLIALALACEPELLIADEPTTALDVMVQAQVLALLAELQRDRGLALLFITHDLSVLTTTCERLAVMYAGRIVEDGSSRDVFGTPAHPYTRALAARVPDHRRPVVTHASARPGRRSTEPGGPSARVPVPRPLRSRRRRVPFGRCGTPRRRRGRRAACIRLGTSDEGPRDG